MLAAQRMILEKNENSECHCSVSVFPFVLYIVFRMHVFVISLLVIITNFKDSREVNRDNGEFYHFRVSKAGFNSRIFLAAGKSFVCAEKIRKTNHSEFLQ